MIAVRHNARRDAIVAWREPSEMASRESIDSETVAARNVEGEIVGLAVEGVSRIDAIGWQRRSRGRLPVDLVDAIVEGMVTP